MTGADERHSILQFKSRAPRTHFLIGTALLLIELTVPTLGSHAQAAVPLPPVTVDSPTPRKPAPRPTAAPARRTQAAVARRQNRNPAPAPPTRTDRAIAAAAAKYQQILAYRAMPSSTTLRNGASPLDTSQTVNVVPEQVIKDQLPRNLDDALMNISGITQANTLGSTQDAVMRRGFGDNRDGSIMRNGMPVVQGRALNADVESVEVLKGPASLLYGIIDPGGIVNTISKKPELYQHGSITGLGSTFGSRNGGETTLDITGPIGPDGLAYRFIADGIDEQYWRNFGSHREMVLAPSLAWYGENTTIQASYQHREFLTPFDRGTVLNTNTNQPFNSVPATRRLDEPYNNMWGVSDLSQISVEQKLNADWKLYAGYTYNQETYTANQLRITALNPTTGIETRSNDGTAGALTSSSYGTSYLQGGFWLGNMRNDVLFGGDAQYRVIYRADLIRNPIAASNVFNIYNPNYNSLTAGGTTVDPASSEQMDKLSERALYFQDTLHLTNQLALVGGVRYMQFEQLAGKGIPFFANTNLTGDKALPIGGVIYKITDWISAYVSYSQSLKPTSTIAAFSTSIANYVVGSNIAPEQGTQWETGLKFDVNDSLSGTLAFYDIEKRNVLVAQLDATTGITTASAAGKVRSRGAELDVTGKLSDNWSMIGSYAYTDARVTQDPLYLGNALQNVALNTGSLYLVYNFGDTLPGMLRVGAGGHYVGNRAGDAANSFILPSYTVADAFATYETKYEKTPVVYQFNIKNIFNKVYYPSAASSVYIAEGDARRYSLSATVKF